MADLRDIVQGMNHNVANGSYLEIKPTAPDKWSIQNIKASGSIELWEHNASGSFKFAGPTTAGEPALFSWVDLHVSETQYMRVKNVSGGAIGISYSGVVCEV